MTKGCTICQRAPATKSICCGQKLCADHELQHLCPRAAELLAMDKESARAFLSREDSLTTAVVEALRKLPEILRAWQSRKRGGLKARDAAKAVSDVTAVSRDGAVHIEVETKSSHPKECECASCAAQREWGELLVASGGVYVSDVRNVQQAVDGVRMGLARARAKDRRTA